MIEKHINTLADICVLSDAEFERFMPDFIAWFYGVKAVQKTTASTEFIESVSSSGFIWCDDGNEGAITGVEITDKDTGETMRVNMEQMK